MKVPMRSENKICFRCGIGKNEAKDIGGCCYGSQRHIWNPTTLPTANVAKTRILKAGQANKKILENNLTKKSNDNT